MDTLWLLLLIPLWLGWCMQCSARSKKALAEFAASAGKGLRVLVVIAHPDDESMFFAPTLASLRALSCCSSWILCFSTGDADGLGSVRKKELVRAARHFSIPESHVAIVDHPRLQDGMRNEWDPKIMQDILTSTIKENSINVVISFDSHGVSGHPNHKACYHAMRRARAQQPHSGSDIKWYTLQSTNLIRKYLSFLDVFTLFDFVGSPSNGFGLFCHKQQHSVASVRLLLAASPMESHRGMQMHRSQFVWYRRLFVIFSRYAYINVLEHLLA
eukprot:g55492.t1